MILTLAMTARESINIVLLRGSLMLFKNKESIGTLFGYISDYGKYKLSATGAIIESFVSLATSTEHIGGKNYLPDVLDGNIGYSIKSKKSITSVSKNKENKGFLFFDNTMKPVNDISLSKYKIPKNIMLIETRPRIDDYRENIIQNYSEGIKTFSLNSIKSLTYFYSNVFEENKMAVAVFENDYYIPDDASEYKLQTVTKSSKILLKNYKFEQSNLVATSIIPIKTLNMEPLSENMYTWYPYSLKGHYEGL